MSLQAKHMVRDYLMMNVASLGYLGDDLDRVLYDGCRNELMTIIDSHCDGIDTLRNISCNVAEEITDQIQQYLHCDDRAEYYSDCDDIEEEDMMELLDQFENFLIKSNR